MSDKLVVTMVGEPHLLERCTLGELCVLLIFSDAALDEIFQFPDGAPRVIDKVYFMHGSVLSGA